MMFVVNFLPHLKVLFCTNYMICVGSFLPIIREKDRKTVCGVYFAELGFPGTSESLNFILHLSHVFR